MVINLTESLNKVIVPSFKGADESYFGKISFPGLRMIIWTYISLRNFMDSSQAGKTTEYTS